jgi:hypothetical protein
MFGFKKKVKKDESKLHIADVMRSDLEKFSKEELIEKLMTAIKLLEKQKTLMDESFERMNKLKDDFRM